MLNKNILTAAFATSLIATAISHPALARNPHSGDLGSTTPGSDVFTFGNLQTTCSTQGAAEANLKTKTANGKRQLFVHIGAQQSTTNYFIGDVYSSCQATLPKPLKVRTPFTFQLLGGNGLAVEVNFQYGSNAVETLIFAKPNSPLQKFEPGLISLTDLGNNKYGIPVGSGRGQLPDGASIVNVIFIDNAIGFCHEYDSDVNNLVMGPYTSQIDTTSKSKSCGESCN